MGKCTLALREGSRGEWGWCVTATVGGAAAHGQDGLPRVTAGVAAAARSWSRGLQQPRPISVTLRWSLALSGPPFPGLKYDENQVLFHEVAAKIPGGTTQAASSP